MSIVQQRPSVFIIEDHELFCLGIQAEFSSLNMFDVLGHAGSVSTGVEEALRLKPDLLMIDLNLPDGHGIDVLNALKDKLPETKFIMLTSDLEDENILKSFSTGASAYCCKDISTQQLLHAVDVVLDGGVWFDPSIGEYALSVFNQGAEIQDICMSNGYLKNERTSILTEEQLKTLQFLIDGASVKEISIKTGAEVKHVKQSIVLMMNKLMANAHLHMNTKAFMSQARN